MPRKYDIAIIGAGISGFSSALRLQNKGYKTILLEAHGQTGGCAGFFKKKNFSFDVGATTLVDFSENGVGGKFLKELGIKLPKHSVLDYKFWLPDRVITLYNDRTKWKEERIAQLGNSNNHLRFWHLIDRITNVFWDATRLGVKLPIQSLDDIFKNIKAIGLSNLPLMRYLNVSTLDILKKFKLEDDKPLVYFLSALIEDTIHSNIKDAPFINAALGTTIRGAGLMRLEGGMRTLWRSFEEKYKAISGELKKGNKVNNLQWIDDLWQITTNKAEYSARKIISSLPISNTIELAPSFIKKRIQKYFKPDINAEGSAVVIFLGVPEEEVQEEALTHHQIIESYEQPLGMGNNMFISISDKNDFLSAPKGFRSVMISTHCDLESWKGLSEMEYQQKKKEIAAVLLKNARKIYPTLADNPIIFEVGTPKSYQTYTHRNGGAVGGFKQTIINSNLKSIPQNIGLDNFYLVGDNTWPGLGTVAGIVSSRIVADEIK